MLGYNKREIFLLEILLLFLHILVSHVLYSLEEIWVLKSSNSVSFLPLDLETGVKMIK